MVDLAEAPAVIPAEGSGDPALTRARLKLAAVCMVGLGVATTVLPFWAVDASRGPMMLELGWGADQLSVSYALMLWAAALSVWPIGLLIDRLGARLMVAAGAVAIAPILLMLPFVRHFWQFCILFALLGVCRSVVLGYSKIVATLFDRRRGLALGVFAAEVSALSMMLPLGTSRLVSENGWRGAFTILGLVVLVVAPVLYIGLGKREPGAADAERSARADWRASQAIRTRTFWLIIVAALVSEGVSGIVLNALQTALPHRGFGDIAYLRGAPLILLATLAGPICAGFLLDRTRSPAMAVAAFLASAAAGLMSSFVTPSMGGMPLLMTSFVLGAFAFSAQAPVVAYLLSRYFGLKSFATIWSLQIFIQAVAMGLAIPRLAPLAGPIGNEPLLMAMGTAAPLIAALLYLLLPPFNDGANREPGLDGQSPRAFRTWWSRAPS